MAATIQTILKPTRARGLDTSGNNNHAQIYSGRALEFDGVTDYLNVGTSVGQIFIDYSEETTAVNRAWTVAVWLNYDAAGSSNQSITGFDNSEDVSTSNYLRLSNTETLGFYDIGGNASRTGDTVLKPKTWYRAVFVYNGSDTVNFYLNGVADGSGTLTSSNANNNADLNISYIGGAFQSSVFGSAFAGKMSDFQAWQGAWTADDAMYDYLNPEQLVLNRGGTSLTNSNLKLWYPMNEGHRGEQSYVLDASNTGLGDDIVNWSSTFNASGTSTNNFGSWTTNANDSTTFCTFDHDNKTIRLRTTNSTHLQAFYVPEILKYGTTYKFEFTVSEITSGSVRVRPQDTSEYLTVSEVGTYSYIVSPENSITDLDFRIERGASEATDVTISDVKIFPINDKNSATTVFYGDDLFDGGDAEVGAVSNITVNSVASLTNDGTSSISTEQAHAGSKSLKLTGDSSSTYPAFQWSDGSNMGLVAGRTYSFEAYYYLPSGQNLDRVQIRALANDSSVISSDIHTETDAWTKLGPILFTDDDIDRLNLFTYENGASAQDLTGDSVYFDSISLKEVGTATGWTDADQQLDIPQTALQSYNQLGFSYGEADGASGSINCGAITSVSWTTLDVWFFVHKSGYSQGLLDQISWSGDDSDSSTGGYGFRVTVSTTDKIQLTRRVSGTNISNTMTSTNNINVGKWNHVAVVIPKNDGTSMRLMVNGHYEQTNSSGDHGITEKDFRLGYAGGINYDSMPGCIAQVSYFKEHMSETQMLELYNEGTPIDSRNHSVGTNNLAGYWRNNGVYGNTWTNLANPGTNNGAPSSLITETMLITAGVDSSRDSQGFFMNRQRLTNTLNLPIIEFANNGDVISSNDVEVMNPALTYSDTGFSVECWFKAAMLGEPGFIITHQEASNSGEGFHIRWAGANTIYAVISDGTNEANAQVSTALNADQWYHIVTSWDHSNKKKYVYIDGILRQVETESSMGTIAPNVDIHIGSRRGEGSQMFTGQIDDVKLYNRILTDGGVTTGQSDSNGLSIASKGEVLRNYKAGKRSHK